jgi:hypothetical protein
LTFATLNFNIETNLQLSHSNEGVGSQDNTDRQLFSATQNHESAGIIFMDIYKEMSIEKVKGQMKCSFFFAIATYKVLELSINTWVVLLYMSVNTN